MKNKAVKKQSVPYIFVAIVIIIAIIVIVVGNYIDKHTPSKKMVSNNELMDIYGFNNDSQIDKDKQAAIILSNQLIENRALVEDGVVYLEYHFVKSALNDKFYWDNHENILLYTLPKDIVKTTVGSNTYEVTKTQNQVDYQIVKTDGSNVYIAMEFVQLYTDMESSYYENPSRVVINHDWNTEIETATAGKSVKLRKSPKIKAEILYSLKDKSEVTITETKGKWSYVYTKDGHFGYVENSSLKNKGKKTLTSTFVQPEYTSNQMSGKVNLSWQVVTNNSANNQLVGLVTSANGLNVVAPQWYRLSDNEGNMTSFADANYVSIAHRMGLKVWAVVDDQSENSDNANVFPYTSKREKLINQLIADAIQYNIDGINVDFEYIKPENADDYIQFIRELSVKCRINGIILSVDNKVPEASNEYYNLKAQGEVVDYVVIMGYDEHWGTDSGAGSVASLSWITDGIAKTVADVDSSKVVLAIPFYTRFWIEDASGNLTDVQTVDMVTALSTVNRWNVESAWLDDCGQNYAEYTDDAEGKTYRVWLEDAASIEKKLGLIGQYNLGGVASWRLGFESNDIWNIIIKYVN